MQIASAKFLNDVYEPIREYIKANHGWSSEALTQTELYKQYQANMDTLKSFDGERVRIQYLAKSDHFSSRGEKTGRVVVKDDKVMFFEGRNRTKHFILDAGMYEGFFAVLVVLQMEII